MELVTPELTRRQMLGALGAAAGGLVLPPAIRLPRADAATPGTQGFGAERALRAAMHVHGSWSEGLGSWDAQFTQAASGGYDLLYLTDHDMRAMALGYLTSLSGVGWDPPIRTGSLAQQAATASSGGSVRVLAESATTTAASITLPLQAKPTAFNRFRTSVSGLTIKQTIGTAKLTNGARYELVLWLSYHPARSGRPAGQYRLVYRFGGARGRWKEGSGLIGVVSAPTPVAGATQTLVPTQDIAALWPDLVAADNSSYGLSFVAKSPARGAVCDVSVRSVSFGRSRSTAAAVIADQAAMIAAYGPRFSTLAARATTETSKTLPDMNPFGTGPWFPDYSGLPSNDTLRHQAIADQVHAMGGIISWNHPFGYDTGPLLGPAERAAKRRQVFSALQAVGRFDADILEVGYNLRGQVDAPTHVALWDTFSRNGNFLTGNGTTDDHSGQGWRNLSNGFATGVWAASTAESAVVPALAAGRAFAAHPGRWPGEIDLLVDDTVPMGAVSVSTKNSRSLAIWATALPPGGRVQVVAGPVDYAGQVDPGTWVATGLAPSAFAGNVAHIALDTRRSRFFRVQVLDAAGQLVGTSNPVWLVRSNPPGGIPTARRVR